MSKKHYQEAIIRFHKRGSDAGLSYDELETIRRAAMTLHRWSEHECNGTIQRDEETGKPYGYVDYTSSGGKAWRHPVPDRETPALNRVKDIAKKHGLVMEYNGDPRGWPLSFKKLGGSYPIEFAPPV